MSRMIEDILYECLHLMAQGRTVEECLSSFPEQAAELEPLLLMAVSGQRAMGLPQPSTTARAAGRQDMLTALAARRKRRRRLFPLRGWALAATSLIFAVILGSGTVMASFQSVPEETLYPVMRAVEKVQLALSTSPAGQAHTLVRHSDNRALEIERRGG
jgi:hypothetical protein